ncbi:CLUMA_CG000701, isoform A [Clunio marinus]|uniref:CLUMA_CG000701, isoform A n=1 Tax=Clunio marinus TaxID=568069 RepID=A0A1J1HHI1_9DIPT|nr:CLUMA_CG000701, isoform A [Clunio marinus]
MDKQCKNHENKLNSLIISVDADFFLLLLFLCILRITKINIEQQHTSCVSFSYKELSNITKPFSKQQK